MRIALVDQYTDKELEQILKQSNSMREFVSKLGYKSLSGDSVNLIKKRIKNLDTSHFKSKPSVKRTEENIFIKNSTADGSVARKWYKKGEYIPYKCSICGQEPFWNGKEMTLILDHINGVNNDHRLENLRWVCPNCDIQLDTTNGKNRKTYKKQYYCIDCGIPVSNKSLRCKKCSSIAQSEMMKEKFLTKTKADGSIVTINRDMLKDLIRTKPFLQIGKEFGVSDNAIRKWCKRFNLPTHPKEIKSYTDEEWDLI